MYISRQNFWYTPGMVESLTFITGNPAKVEWLLRHITVPVHHEKLDLPEIQSLDLQEVVRYKAEEAYKRLNIPLLVEDTSLRFNAMGRLPGPLIKWFQEEIGTEGLCKMLNAYDDRKAIAEVMYGLHTGKEILLFEAKINGIISNIPKGENGIGWDKAFIPDGAEKTWGEMNLEEQDKTSLRKIAINKLNEYLNR